MIIQRNIDFVKDINAPTVSKTFFNSASDVLSLEVSGNFTSGKIFVEGRLHTKNDWSRLAAIDLSDFSAVKEGITKAGIYEFGIVSARELRVNVQEAVGGNVSVFGQMISTEET